jgi:hypothetical protein
MGTSVVDTATDYGLGDPEFESLQEKIFSVHQKHPDRLWGVKQPGREF